MVIKFGLSEDSIKNAMRQLDNYENSLKQKAQLFCQELADVGISTAKASTRTYGGFIVFSQQLGTMNSENPVVILYAKKTTDLIREWYYHGEIKRVEIDPLLMEEFGSGFASFNPLDVPGVGQGSFPEQKHAFDEEGWYWTTPDGITHHSWGETPGQPMYHAREEMYQQIRTIARKVFK